MWWVQSIQYSVWFILGVQVNLDRQVGEGGVIWGDRVDNQE